MNNINEKLNVLTEGSIKADALKTGDKIVVSYKNSGRVNSFKAEVLGFTGDDKKYGDGGVKFKSQKEMLAHYSVKSLKALEELQNKNEYGMHSYMVVKDLDSGDSGPWLYPYKGAWVVGSGANRVSFDPINESLDEGKEQKVTCPDCGTENTIRGNAKNAAYYYKNCKASIASSDANGKLTVHKD